MVRIIVPPTSDLYVEILMLGVMVLGGGVFGICLGQEGKSLMNRIIVFKKETSQRFLALYTI